MQTKSLHKTNAIAKPGIRLCPTDRCAIRKKRFWILLPRLAKVSSVSPSRGGRVPLLHGREMVLLLCDQKYHPVPLLREAGTNLLLFQEEGKSVLFRKEKKSRFFCNVTKGTKNTEKGRRLPLPFSNPTPLTNKGDRTFPVCAKFAAAARQIGNKKISSI